MTWPIDDPILSLIDNTQKTLESVLYIVKVNIQATLQNRAQMVMRYIMILAYDDFMSVGDTVQARELVRSVRQLRSEYDKNAQKLYWDNVYQHYFAKYQEIVP